MEIIEEKNDQTLVEILFYNFFAIVIELYKINWVKKTCDYYYNNI